MIRIRLIATLVASFFGALAAPPAIAALAQRTFVSGQGNDANPCSLVAPCRSFSRALLQVAAGGEVVALDSAGYGPFTIIQSVTVQAPPGVYAAITTLSGNGITINAADTDVITLRGLTVVGLGGSVGIVFASGASMTVVDCTVSGFSQSGLSFQPLTTFTHGIVEHSVFASDNVGIAVSPTGSLTVRNSILSGNAAVGVSIFGINASGGATLSVVDSLIDANGVGIRGATNGGGPSHVRISGNHITNNTTGILMTGASDAVSIGNNMVRGNGTEKSGLITIVTGD